MNIYLVYALVSLMAYLVLSWQFHRISWIHTKYSLGVHVGQPDILSSIVFGDAIRLARYILNIYWVHALVRLTSYPVCLGDAVGLTGYILNIHSVYALISLTAYLILSGPYRHIGQPDGLSSIVLVMPSN